MKLREILKVINYDDFNICVDSERGLKSIFKVTKDTPIKYISDYLLASEILGVYIDDENEDNDLFTIEVKLGDE